MHLFSIMQSHATRMYRCIDKKEIMISNYHKTTTDCIGASYRQWTEPQESPGTGTYLVSGTSFIYVFLS